MTTHRSLGPPCAAALAAGVLLLATVACGDDAGSGSAAPVIDPGDGGSYAPSVDAANFVEAIDNPYLPYPPGARWRYVGEADGEEEVTEVSVTDQRKTVMGISAVVVRDTVTVAGEVVEDTFDWFAQDREGNVWYLGEDSKEYEDGKVVSTEGSWEAGVDGALPGIVMLADPQVGDAYRQEYAAGEAEDMAEVVALGGTLDVAAGSFGDVLTTKEWTPLEPETIEQKLYAPGVGMVREESVTGTGAADLVEYSL